jgi:hypothetical protein
MQMEMRSSTGLFPAARIASLSTDIVFSFDTIGIFQYYQ